MALRLTVIEKEDLTVMRVDGRLTSETVTQLEDACRTARRPLVLDLTHLATADDAGVLTLRQLAGGGVHLLGVSPYLSLLLDESVAHPKSSAAIAGRRSKPARRRPGGHDA